jgi:hypothetical protein
MLQAYSNNIISWKKKKKIISIEKERMYVVVRLVSLFGDVGKVGKG